jgi:hypothetical protein
MMRQTTGGQSGESRTGFVRRRVWNRCWSLDKIEILLGRAEILRVNEPTPITIPGSQPPRRKGPTGKRLWLYRLALLIALVPVIELISWIGLRSAIPHVTLDALREEQTQLANSAVAFDERPEVVHPYMGWILNPQTSPQVEVGDQKEPVNGMGFADVGPTLRKRATGHFLLGITGGSVAQQFGFRGAEALKRRLAQSSRFQGVTVDIVRLSFAGFKQPQQLMTLNYLLALGGQLDALVNIDGFNEVALPTCENQDDIFAAYPRLWNTLTLSLIDPRQSALAYRLLELRALRQEASRAMLDSPLRLSPTRNLLWKIRDRYLAYKLIALGREVFEKEKREGRSFAIAGPPQLYRGDKAMFPYLAELWANCSRQLDALCRANGIAYVHVLQPNQYVPDSKPLGPKERTVAISDEQCYGLGVRRGYPELRREGEKLRAEGVDFHDLTRLFAAFADPIYVDNCCHYNQQGNDLLAEAVAEALLANLERRSPRGAK